MKPLKHTAQSRAYTLIELLVTIAIIGILAALILPTLGSAKKKAVKISCLSNLKQLGIAMLSYEHDNGDKLPYAAMRLAMPTPMSSYEISWDSLLNGHLGGQQTDDQLWNPVGAWRAGAAKVLHVLKCPSDTSARPKDAPQDLELPRRSYSMPQYMDHRGNFAHHGGPAPWPPSAEAQAGVGLVFSPLSRCWNKADNNCLDGSPGKPRPSHQAAVKATMLPEPARTILLTEHFHVMNIQGSLERADVPCADDQIGKGEAKNVASPPYFYPPLDSIHGGRLNYLMNDGHVESLFPKETTSDIGLQRGMWSIKAGD
jgi:prepilin-type N-terminal cleavage/methylation domain-containing protein/prepilin-type processing-associated H-X9-DG protein